MGQKMTTTGVTREVTSFQQMPIKNISFKQKSGERFRATWSSCLFTGTSTNSKNTCHNCKKPGHFSRECPDKLEGTCWELFQELQKKIF